MTARRGFAALSPEQRRAVSQKGGRASQAKAQGHTGFARVPTSVLQEWGRKGGQRPKSHAARAAIMREDNDD